MVEPLYEPSVVLVAEGDDDGYMVLALAVKQVCANSEMQRAENGEVLLQALRMAVPDILFLDIQLPLKDGKQCIKEIRANPIFDMLPVIIYASIKQPEDCEYCYREGANFYVIRPTNLDELKQILTRIFCVDWKNALYYPPISHFMLGG